MTPLFRLLIFKKLCIELFDKESELVQCANRGNTIGIKKEAANLLQPLLIKTNL